MAGSAGYRQVSDLTSFVGRQAEIEQVVRLLDEYRLVNLTGPGGAGKTRLALKIVDELAGSFADGICVVGLDSLQDPDLLPQVLADHLGLQSVFAEPEESVVDFLRARSLLLVLDNCEHMAAQCGQLVGRLLVEAPGVRLLTTSRHVLGIDGECVLPLRPLPVPRVENGQLVGDADAITLFVHRAAAAVSGFTLHESNRAAATTICRRLDGMPLAIELAAAWLRVLSLTDLLNRIDESFALLSRGASSKHARQRTLKATVDWSYGLCSPEEQVLWDRLSVFKGGFTLEAAEEVCSGGLVARADVLGLIAELVDKSVLIREGRNGSTRYRMLETILQYGYDRLVASGQDTEFQVRHCSYFLKFAQSAADQWHDGKQLELLKATQAEHANLRAALEFGLNSQAAGLMGAWLAAKLHYFWLNCGFLAEGLRWLKRAIARDGLPNDLRVHLNWAAAWAAAVLGDHETAHRLGEEGVGIARQLGDAELLTVALIGKATALFVMGEYERANASYEESIVWYYKVRDPGARLFPVYDGPAMIAAVSGDADRAETYAERAIQFSVDRGEFWGRAYGHYAMAMAKWLKGETAAARHHAAESVRMTVMFNDASRFAIVAEMLAGMALESGEHDRAAGILGLVEKIWERVGGSLLTGSVAWFDPHQACKSELRRLMGEDRCAAAFKVGEAYGTSLSRAAEFLFERASVGRGPLTKRETDVAELVARGLTNKEIASRLSVSPRTVEVHIDHILRKLDFNSRVQIGIWISSR
jgi:non-specific serine/threonine protein kinase